MFSNIFNGTVFVLCYRIYIFIGSFILDGSGSKANNSGKDSGKSSRSHRIHNTTLKGQSNRFSTSSFFIIQTCLDYWPMGPIFLILVKILLSYSNFSVKKLTPRRIILQPSIFKTLSHCRDRIALCPALLWALRSMIPRKIWITLRNLNQKSKNV